MDKAPAELRRSFSTQCRKLHDGMFKHGAPARQFVVVESDWPEYHLVWAMLEHRMAGKPVPNFNDWRRADELQQRLNAADQRNAELTSALEGMVEYFPEGHSDGECVSVEKAKAVLAALKPTESGASE